jgi:hypothetical protein
MWFDGWESLLRILIHGTLGYIALVFMLRLSGKRTLSKMNAFDFVITIALGSAFATLLISDMVPLINGVVAIALLVTPAVGGILDLREVGALRVDREGHSSAGLLEGRVPRGRIAPGAHHPRGGPSSYAR